MSIKNQNIKILSPENQIEFLYNNNSDRNNLIFDNNYRSSYSSIDTISEESLIEFRESLPKELENNTPIIEYRERISENDFITNIPPKHKRLSQKRFNQLILNIKYLSSMDKLKLKYIY